VNVRVKSRHGEANDGFREAAEVKLGRAAKGFDAVDAIEVELDEHKTRRPDQRFRLEDDAVDRFSRQLLRLKDRIIDGHRKPADQPGAVEEPDGHAEVVRVKQFIMKPVSVDEAALQMDLLGHSFFFFLNAATDKQCVLYRRADGRLGMIEPA
jgi:putative sigma-54 modulation protein